MRKPLTLEQKAARDARKRQWYLANRERVLAVNQAYREKNPELIARLKKEWADENKEKLRRRLNERRAANPEKRKQYDAEWRQKKKPHLKEYQKAYYMNNSEIAKKRSAQWQKNNKPRHLESTRNRFIGKWLLRAGWTPEEFSRRLTLGCEICKAKLEYGHNGLVFDHDHETGMVRGLLCAKCNRNLDWAIEFYEEIGCYFRLAQEMTA